MFCLNKEERAVLKEQVEAKCLEQELGKGRVLVPTMSYGSIISI